MSPLPETRAQRLAATAVETPAAPTAPAKRAAPTARPRPKAAPPHKSRIPLVGGIAIVAALGLGGAGYFLLNRAETSPATADPVQQTGEAGDPATAPSQAPDPATLAADSLQLRLAYLDSLATAMEEQQRERERRRVQDSVANARLLAQQAAAARQQPPAGRTGGTGAQTTPAAPTRAQDPPPQPVVPQNGHIRIGTRIPNSYLFIGDNAVGPLIGLRYVQIPAGATVRVSIRADGCQPWDSTVVIPPIDTTIVGYRSPSCQ